MGEQTRLALLSLLCIHHIHAWINMISIKGFHVIDPNIKAKLSVYKDFGPRFLTNWNFFNQTVYIFIALYILLAPKFFSNQEKLIMKLKKINWYNFWSIVFPWSLYIPSLFWSVYVYDRELIFPSYIDYIFPFWLNHSIHTNIFLLLFLEAFNVDQRPPKFTTALRTLTLYSLCYVSVLVFTYFNNGIWLYGFLRVLTWPQRILAFAATYLFLVGSMWIGVTLQNNKYQRSLVKKN